ncbi:MAG: hypothetical protein ABIF82_10060 [Planctomycetota bacterium]
MQKTLWILTLTLIVLMSSQWGFHVGGTEKAIKRETTETLADGSTMRVEKIGVKREGGVNVTPGDALLVILFLLWAGYVIAKLRVAEIRWPFAAVFVFLALVLVSAVHAGHLKPGLREFLQLGAYFVGGWLVFANCIDTRPRLRAAAELFTVAVAAVVVIALIQYKAAVNGNVFNVGGSFGNRNTLGAFLAVSLPFVFALALYEERLWQRFALMLTVAIGAGVVLSGGALLAVAAGVLFIAALKSQKALIGVLIALVLAVVVVADQMPPGHTDTVISSVQPYIAENHLDRGRQPEGSEGIVVAARYRRWHAATRLIRRHCWRPFLGVGPARFNEAIGEEYGAVEKPSGDTDDARAFNINAPEPDTFNMYLVTCAEAGPVALLALLWLGALLLGRNVREHGACRDDFGKALALGAAGAVVGAAVCAVFSNILVRGVAMPFIFVALSGILWAKLPVRPVRRR